MRLTDEFGEVANDEVELGQRVWLRLGEDGVIGDDALEVPDAPEESRECWETRVCDESLGSILSSCFRGATLGNEKERTRFMLCAVLDDRLQQAGQLHCRLADACAFRFRDVAWSAVVSGANEWVPLTPGLWVCWHAWLVPIALEGCLSLAGRLEARRPCDRVRGSKK